MACRGSFIVLQTMLVVFVSIAEQEEGEEEEGVLLLCNKVLVKPFPSSS